ncbi:hypothetical protein LTR70_006355 [Exophiala xenobiotica]|uniref:Carboxylic ester hydrolase n=1 Tax=Lithohypha guttulata TaxID=1690604 RepID=A0ABR0K9Q6_9EURO|nr:hypothetical protein LTR24_005824 [Lithohypha guttulata]KAK5316300.1 hypothetical protein LTR70_006355 [Exophiala xenobiotica]
MLVFVVVLLASFALSAPTAIDSQNNVTYNGLTRNGLDVFLGIRYAEDTSGENRFKPPRPHTPASGSIVNANSYGAACPQPPNSFAPPLTLTNITRTSEDCLNLNIIRPNGTLPASKLPVLVFIHGGSFWTGSNQEITTSPDGLIIQSVEAGLPIVHVALNYRLGAFGFAQSSTLKNQRSENAGLRDQRLAIEWVRDNIAQFGGDPQKITIHGQSSGGLAIGMQTLAFGGDQPVPFQQGICESQALEPGITGNFTIVQMQLLADATGCNTTDLNSVETIACLRQLDTDTIAQASFDTYVADIAHNIGDSWLPVVDGDFLPAPPSQLLAEGRFANVTTMILWAESDVQYYTPMDITTEQDTYDFVASYLPGFTNQSIQDILTLYPSSDFQDNTSANHTREFYRSARLFRDVIMTCQPIGYGEHLARMGNQVYLVDQNQTLLSPILASLGFPGLGPVHTSEFAYTFGNISHYNVSGYPFNPTAEDYRLQRQEARSWAAFASVGQPSLYTKDTLQGFEPAFTKPNETAVFVAGGSDEGLSTFDGPGSRPGLAAQKLRSRCGFINSPSIIPQLQY